MWDKVFEDSSMVQEVMKRGERMGAIAESRKQLSWFGQAKLGPPDASTIAAIDAIDDLDRLHSLSKRLLTVNSWDELLAP